MNLHRSLLPVLGLGLVLGAALGVVHAEPGRDSDVPAGRAADSRRTTLPATPAALVSDMSGAPARSVVPSAPEALEVVAPTGHFGPEVPVEGRTSTLTGRVRVDEAGTRATLRFVAGPNVGRELVTGPDGRYVWSELYPGLGVLSVEAGFRCTRQVVLRHRKTDELAVELGDHGVVHGRLVDEQGEPVADAPLTLDGQPGSSDRDGRFAVACHAAGPPELVVRQPGFVAYREVLRPEDGRDRPHEVELRRGRSFELQLGEVPGGGEVQVWLRPMGAERSAGAVPRPAFPWEEVNPIRVPAHGRVRVDDLPPVKLEARAVHPLARGRAVAWPRRETDEPTPLSLTLEPLPSFTVRVLRDGEAVPAAEVALTRPNLLAASLATWGPGAERLLNARALSILPSARQHTLSGRDGRCQVGCDPAVKGAVYLTVTAPDGTLSITREVQRRTGELIVDLARPGV